MKLRSSYILRTSCALNARRSVSLSCKLSASLQMAASGYLHPRDSWRACTCTCCMYVCMCGDGGAAPTPGGGHVRQRIDEWSRCARMWGVWCVSATVSPQYFSRPRTPAALPTHHHQLQSTHTVYTLTVGGAATCTRTSNFQGKVFAKWRV